MALEFEEGEKCHDLQKNENDFILIKHTFIYNYGVCTG